MIVLYRAFFLFVCFSVYVRSAKWQEVSGLIQCTCDTIESSCPRIGWTYVSKTPESGETKKIDAFTFQSGCCSSSLIKFNDYNTENSIHRYFYFGGSNTLSALYVSIKHIDARILLSEGYRNDNMFVYFGCYDKNSICRGSIVERTVVEVTQRGVVLFGNLDERIELRYSRNPSSTPPMIFVTGNVPQSVLVNVFTTGFSSTTNNPNNYVLTGKLNTWSFVSTTTGNSNYAVKSICNRNEIDRLLIYTDSSIEAVQDCSCFSSQTSLISLGSFNYPDCKTNSSLFDVDLRGKSTIITLEAISWWSWQLDGNEHTIKASNSASILSLHSFNINFSQPITIENGAAIVELEINKAKMVLFKNSLSVTNAVNSIVEDTVLFTVEGNSVLPVGVIKQCGNRVVRYDSLISCVCEWNENGYYYFDGVVDSSCPSYKMQQTNVLDLVLISNYITGDVEYWNEIRSTSSTIKLRVNLVSFAKCSFLDKEVLVEGSLHCELLEVNAKTKLVVSNGELSVGTILFSSTPLHYNLNGIILLNNSILLSSPIDIILSSTQNCFELISSDNVISQSFILSSANTKLNTLSDGKLIRICPSSSIDSTVKCTLLKSELGSGDSYSILHCPCFNTQCEITVATSKIILNKQFNGKLVIPFNSVNTLIVNSLSFTSSLNIRTQNTIISVNSPIGLTLNFESTFVSNYLISKTNLGFSQTPNTLSTTLVSSSKCFVLELSTNVNNCVLCEEIANYNGICAELTQLPEHCTKFSSFSCTFCEEGFEPNGDNCLKCPSNCKRCYNSTCVTCDTNYLLSGMGQCEPKSETVSFIENNKVLKCVEGYFSTITQCIPCSNTKCSECGLINGTELCFICKKGSIFNYEGVCVDYQVGVLTASSFQVNSCSDYYYIDESSCLGCNIYGTDCVHCDNSTCLRCLNGIINLEGNCVDPSEMGCGKLNAHDTYCSKCVSIQTSFNEEECLVCSENCLQCVNGRCIECELNYHLLDWKCISSEVELCSSYRFPQNDVCLECENNFFLNDTLYCSECNKECETCLNSTHCLSCIEGYSLLDYTCQLSSLIIQHCKATIPGSTGGCAVCEDYYYRKDRNCSPCISNCSICFDSFTCIECSTNYFLLSSATQCLSYDVLTNCTSKTHRGCASCEEGFYLSNQFCQLCSTTIPNCQTCSSSGVCYSCDTEHVLINSKCVSLELIDKCTEITNSKCSKCSFWFRPTNEGTGCEKHAVWWVIVFIILFTLFILTAVGAVLYLIIIFILKRKRWLEQKKRYSLFYLKNSNIEFLNSNNPNLILDKLSLTFIDTCENRDEKGKEIPVGLESTEILHIANCGNHPMKVQFTLKETSQKYVITTNPQVIILPKHVVVPFQIKIKPCCTCEINDEIVLVGLNLRDKQVINTSVQVHCVTQVSTRIDPDELIEEKKIGEGGFGIVYKGSFRGNKVAIKKMKGVDLSSQSMAEFEREVAMLDKFRCEYIVHFFGACFIPGKISMVTEFAEFGSLQHLLDKKKQPNWKWKIKLMKDAAKGIEYLHNNGILHRDIKPDNILIFTLDNTVNANGKLTDFGSARNINLLMSNMTFTKGIGTPVYMAPEILKKQHYKEPADVYSFAITMFECFKWEEAYPRNHFVFPWSIAEFVESGKRLSKPDSVPQHLFEIVDNSWKHEPSKRYYIEDVIEKLNVALGSYEDFSN